MRTSWRRAMGLGLIAFPLVSLGADTTTRKADVVGPDDLAAKLRTNVLEQARLQIDGERLRAETRLRLKQNVMGPNSPIRVVVSDTFTTETKLDSGLPPGAVPFQFNGMTYYIVPVGK
ncbi:MAG: hypothetical protein JWM57_1858 [Phycisphaerales bacterium]|nr:hypothetical protein [Phycisphaerales bacterium]